MKVGTKSLLFGVHQFALHPYYVVLAWRELYGRWPTWREAICIVVHDWGYLGCADMDGADGEDHPLLGASIAGRLFNDGHAELCAFHSRTFAKKHGQPISRLCAPDKLANALMPRWLYLTLARTTGEIFEYRKQADDYDERTGRGCPGSASHEHWHAWMCSRMTQAARKAMESNEGF